SQVHAPKWRSALGPWHHKFSVEMCVPSASVNSEPRPVSPPNRPLFTLCQHCHRKHETGASRAAGMDNGAPHTACRLAVELPQILLDGGFGKDGQGAHVGRVANVPGLQV